MVRFGIIGTGNIADKFYQANRFRKNFELTAVYGGTMEEAEEFGIGKGRLQYFDDIGAFAQSGSFDAVYIASPNSCHHDQAVAMMRAGRHVLCEKPLASNAEEAEHMYQVAEEENVILMEALHSVYTPGFEKMAEYMETLGTIRRATFQYCRKSPWYENYKRGVVGNEFRPELSGGALMNLGVCPVECMIRLFGEPKAVRASCVKLEAGIDGAGSILMEYEGMLGEVIYSMITDAAMPSQIQGEDACMLIRDIENVKDLRISRRKVDQAIHFEQSDNTLNHETMEFIRMVMTGTGWERARDVSLASMRAMDEARRQTGIRFPAEMRGGD